MTPGPLRPPTHAFHKSMYLQEVNDRALNLFASCKSSQYYIIIIMCVSYMLVFHQSKCISDIKHMLSTATT